MLPRAIGLPLGQISSLCIHRVTRVIQWKISGRQSMLEDMLPGTIQFAAEFVNPLRENELFYLIMIVHSATRNNYSGKVLTVDAEYTERGYLMSSSSSLPSPHRCGEKYTPVKRRLIPAAPVGSMHSHPDAPAVQPGRCAAPPGSLTRAEV